MAVAGETSGLLERATLSVDWYQIEIADAIAPGDSWSVYANCFNQDGVSNPSYAYISSCELIARDQDGYRATVITPYYNLSGIETSGIDVAFNMGFDALGGNMSFTSVVNFLDYYRTQQLATSHDIVIVFGATGLARGHYHRRPWKARNSGIGAAGKISTATIGSFRRCDTSSSAYHRRLLIQKVVDTSTAGTHLSK